MVTISYYESTIKLPFWQTSCNEIEKKQQHDKNYYDVMLLCVVDLYNFRL